jgi:transcriptional regulator with XRE-family HTH domain
MPKPVKFKMQTGFAKRLKRAREARGYSQRFLAAKAGIVHGTIGLLESSTSGAARERATTLETIAKLSAALGCDPAWLAYGVVGIREDDPEEEEEE